MRRRGHSVDRRHGRHAVRTLARAAIAMLAGLPAVPGQAEERIGVVLMHGKQSAPDEHDSLADAIAAAGYLVERPEMCWSRRRIYDRPYPDCLRDIDTAIDRLKARGAAGLVIAGHSLGANAALAYGAAHRELKGVIALAPGHRPEVLARRPPIAQGLEAARALVAAGRGDSAGAFPDYNGDLAITVRATPRAYLSFFAPDGPALMPANAAKLTAPLLYVVGTADRLQRGPEEIFAKAPAHSLNRYESLPAGHFATAAAARNVVVAWLKDVGRR
jgi:pimeloyl-ACP methyl ester carboxylesterase